MIYDETICPGCEKGTVVRHGDTTNFHYTCSRAPKCKWQHIGLVQTWLTPKPKAQIKKKHSKGVEFVPDSAEFQAELRAEVERRMQALATERAKFPPSLIKKGKRWVANPKFTNKMREHMHEFYVDVTEVREELLHA